MRDRVSVLRKESTPVGSRGQRDATFSQIEKRWASVEFLTGAELERARKIYESVTARIRIRKPYEYTLTTQDRIGFRGEVYGIGGIVPESDRFEYLNLLVAVVN